jgi:hypothetical protein
MKDFSAQHNKHDAQEYWQLTAQNIAWINPVYLTV